MNEHGFSDSMRTRPRRSVRRRCTRRRSRDAELRDHATRAAKSAFLGLCETLPSDAAGILSGAGEALVRELMVGALE
jgi:hypothetical protein